MLVLVWYFKISIQFGFRLEFVFADGAPGVGKSMTLSCMAHYAYAKEFVLVYLPWGKEF
jgi:DNA replication protein DnaC